MAEFCDKTFEGYHHGTYPCHLEKGHPGVCGPRPDRDPADRPTFPYQGRSAYDVPAEPWFAGLRGARCHNCETAWAWKASSAAPVRGAHCPDCGARLHLTNLRQITRYPIKPGFPWYRGDDSKRAWSKSNRFANVGTSSPYSVGYWYTFDSGPGSDVRQEGRRLRRLWTPVDVAPPGWLKKVDPEGEKS